MADDVNPKRHSAETDLRLVVAAALFNLSGLPDWYARAALGRDYSPLVNRIVPAVQEFIDAQRADGADGHLCGDFLVGWDEALKWAGVAVGIDGHPYLLDTSPIKDTP